MNKQAAALITTAMNEVGYLEKASDTQLEEKTANAGSSNFTKYGEWYGQNGYAWCAMFVSYCAAMAGISTDIIPKHKSCTSEGVAFFKRVGRWHLRGAYTPIPGDIIYFTNDNGATAAHVGIVYDVDDSKVYTIEGNTSGGSTLIANGGGVSKKRYPLSYESIFGFGNPFYTESEEIMTKDDVLAIIKEYEAEKAAAEPSEWSWEARMWAEGNGIITGDGNGNMQYQKDCTREMMVVLLYRMFNILRDMFGK
ncbi:CHAP domain-containing protein [Oscillospiraceae bacterium WX1]